ncbi:phosphatidylinositol N-acetylglucosaminyltransferase [Blumeria hordei DH14]|uniref:Phosphatidylinositol N-acetylglucosaminyltransferase n=1 Tax=Blumeria graminis f. sp. hordei (strain DH14) TaxID=546991 RepID=N1J7T2_BLUG1|nr:phosphatidylinositol N-acetylglucosaminyltransferase [Blumeria hordei DH14]
MLVSRPNLSIRRPSPTTIEFNVSSSPTSRRPLRRLLLALTTLVRLGLGLNVLLVLFHRSPLSQLDPTIAAEPPNSSMSEYFWHYVLHAAHSRGGQYGALLAARLPPYLLLPLAMLALYVVTRRFERHESLLVLRGLGVQTSSSSCLVGGGCTTRFVPMEKIQDILINEAFYGFAVRYYLVVVVEGESELLVVFPRLLPRRQALEQVWRESRACLWESLTKIKD